MLISKLQSLIRINYKTAKESGLDYIPELELEMRPSAFTQLRLNDYILVDQIGKYSPKEGFITLAYMGTIIRIKLIYELV